MRSFTSFVKKIYISHIDAFTKVSAYTVFTCALLFLHGLWSTSYTWIGTTAFWSDPNNWSPVGTPNDPTDTATFDNAVTATTVDNIFQVDALLFSGTDDHTISQFTPSDYLILGGGTNPINISSAGSGVYTIATPLEFVTTAVISQDNTTNALTISGDISNIGGLTLEGTSGATLILSGTNTYTGATTITSGMTLQAGSTAALSSTSSYEVVGVLDLNDNANTIEGLSGSSIGSVTLGSATLTLSSPTGDAFAGVISGSGSVVLTSGQQTFTGANSYAGGTTINGGTLSLEGGGNLYDLGAVSVDGELDISNVNGPSITIGDLSGSGTVIIGNNTLIVGNGSTSDVTFSGSLIDGSGLFSGGSLTYSGGGTWTLSGTSSNTYTGTTNVTGNGSSGTLQAGANDAFSPYSDFVTLSLTTLDLNNFDNTLQSLSGAGNVTLGSGTLTLTNGSNGGSISGDITGTGGINLEGETLTLSGSGNTYSGATIVTANGSLQAGAANALSPSSLIILQGNSSSLDLQAFSNTIVSLEGDSGSIVTIDSGAILTLSDANGETYAGIIYGDGGVALSTPSSGSGEWNLSGSNTYAGSTTISAGASLVLQDSGDIASSGSVSVAGTLDISLTSSGVGINDLSGAGSIELGEKTLTINETSDTSFTGNIEGTTGGLIVQGGSTLTLGGTSSYLGSTTITSGTTLQAGSTAALSSNSSYEVVGVLDLNDHANTIDQLTGSGTVQTTGSGTGGILTINYGGIFSGTIDGTGTSGGLTLLHNTLTLAGAGSSYFGATTIEATATLQTAVANALSPNSDFLVAGTLSLTNQPESIASLSGSGSVITGGSDGILTISNGGSFTGSFSGNGGLNLTGGTLTLTPDVEGSISYTGATTLSNSATLTAGTENAFAPSSDFTLQDSSTLTLNGYSQTIKSLSSSSTTTTVDMGGIGSGATLTINGGETTTFDGIVTNLPCGSLTISGGTNLTLTHSSNDYCGATLIEEGTLQVSGGGLSANTDITVESSGKLIVLEDDGANSLINRGTVNLALNENEISSGSNATLTLATTYEQDSDAISNLGFTTGSNGNISAAGNISIDGTLNIYATTGYPTSGIFPLFTSTGDSVNGEFSTVEYFNFNVADNPNISYSLSEVSLFFADVDATWNEAGDGNWGNGIHWDPTTVPGLNTDSLDIANFEDVSGFPPTITVTLANQIGFISFSPTLFELNFDASNTQFTIEQFSSSGQIIFDSPSSTPQLNVLQGSHVINAPIVLNQDTEFILGDGAELTLDSSSSVSSDDAKSLTIRQSSSSTSGTGTLVNNTTLSPDTISILSATVQNEGLVTPADGLTIAASTGASVTFLNSGVGVTAGPTASGASLIVGGGGTTTVTNSGSGAFFGPTETSGDLTIGSSGTTIVTNSGSGATFGPIGTSGDLTIGSSGTTTVTNSGSGAFFGPTGIGGNLTIGSSGTTIVTNSGIGATFGPTGAGGNLIIQGANTTVDNIGVSTLMAPSGNGGSLTISGGTVNNLEGATLRAGPGRSLTVSGGTVYNSLTSTLGSSNANFYFTGGTIINAGDIIAFDYTQTAPATLQLDLTDLPSIYGNVAASGTASLNGALVVHLLSGATVESNSSVDLITADKGVSGMYSSVSFTNFPDSLIPSINYTTDAVQLIFSGTATPSSITAVSSLTFGSISEIIFRTERNQSFLYRRMFDKKKRQECKNIFDEKKRRECEEKRREAQTSYTPGVSYEGVIAQAEIDPDADQSLLSQLGAPQIERKEHQLAQSMNDENDETFHPTRFYFGPLDSFGTFKTAGSFQPGFNYNSCGFFTGIDHAFEEDWGLGIAVDYRATSADMKEDAGHLDIHQVHATSYAVLALPQNPALALEAIVGFSYDSYQISRKAGPSFDRVTAKGYPKGIEIDSTLGAEYLFLHDQFRAIPQNLTISPFLYAQFAWLNIRKFQEHGAGIYNLKINRQIISSLQSSLGFRLDYLVKRKNVMFQPELTLSWQHEYLNLDHNIYFSTINLSQTKRVSVNAVGPGRDTLLLGIDFLITAFDIFEVETSYDFQWNSLYKNHSFYLGIGARF